MTNTTVHPHALAHIAGMLGSVFMPLQARAGALILETLDPRVTPPVVYVQELPSHEQPRDAAPSGLARRPLTTPSALDVATSQVSVQNC
jgi:hypothetical protein